jgi:beta-glucosidase
MSDWGATHSGWPAAAAGEDMDMPGTIGFSAGGPSYFGSNITRSVNNGSLSEDRLDDMCRRIMTPYFRLQQYNYPTIDGSAPALNGNDRKSTPKTRYFACSLFSASEYNYTYNLGPSNIDVRDDHAELIRELGAAGIVLLKNENNTLPLKTPKNVGVFGNDAGDITIGLYFGGDSDLLNIGFEYGVLPVGGGSGTARMTYVINPLDAIKQKVASYDSKALVQYVLNNTEVIDAAGL